MADTIERIANTCETGHEEKVLQYNFNKWEAECYCERCRTFYKRHFTQEESETFRKELNEPMTM